MKIIQLRSSLVLLIFFILTGCAQVLHSDLTMDELMERSSAAAKNLVRDADYSSCELNTRHDAGAFFLKNNLWGKSRIKAAPAYLCVYWSGDKAGWKWQMPEHVKGVTGYPAVQWGEGPWHVTRSMHGFPVRLDSIAALHVAYDVEQHVKHKKYNLAFDLWLSDEFYSRPETVTTEIMVWEDYHDFTSYGSKTARLTTIFGEYELWEGYLKNSEFGQDWQYFAFVRKEKRTTGTVDLKFLMDYLIQHRAISPAMYLTSVELGNEIGNSSGLTLLNEVRLHLERIN